MSRFNIPGLLGAIGELPSVLTRGLLGPLPVNPNMGLDPSQVKMAQDQSVQDMAFGMMATPSWNRAGGLMMARQGAMENYSGRIIDMLRQQEIARVNEERKKREADFDAYRATLPEDIRPIAEVAGLPNVAQAQIESAFAPPPDAQTDDIKEYRLAVQQGFTGSLQDWIMAQKRAAAPSVNVNNNLPPQESRFLGTMGENASKQLDALQTQADSAAKIKSANDRLRPLVNDPKFISGTLGDARLVVAKALGLSGADETQVFFATMGEQVAERIKAFGAGTGLSDKDREFAEKIAGGNIELTPAAIRRIMDMNDKSADAVITKYEERRKFYSQKHPEVLDYYPSIGKADPLGIR